MASRSDEKARRNNTEPARHWKKKRAPRDAGPRENWMIEAQIENDDGTPRELTAMSMGHDVWLPPRKIDRLLRAKLVLNFYESLIDAKTLVVIQGKEFFAHRFYQDAILFLNPELGDADDDFRTDTLFVFLCLFSNLDFDQCYDEFGSEAAIGLIDMVSLARIVEAVTEVSKLPMPTEAQIAAEWKRRVRVLA